MQKKIPWGYIDVKNNNYPIEEYQYNHIDTNYLTGEEEIYRFKKFDEDISFDTYYENYFNNI